LIFWEPSPRSKANHLRSPPINRDCAGDDTVFPLTSAECLAIAERKIVEVMGDRRHGKELKLTAQAWMVLAEEVRQGEALRKQAEALKIAKLAPDIASTAASAYCGFLEQIADDIRAFHLSSRLRLKTLTAEPVQCRPGDFRDGLWRIVVD
jgi:hypothetical protein